MLHLRPLLTILFSGLLLGTLSRAQDAGPPPLEGPEAGPPPVDSRVLSPAEEVLRDFERLPYHIGAAHHSQAEEIRKRAEALADASPSLPHRARVLSAAAVLRSRTLERRLSGPFTCPTSPRERAEFRDARGQKEFVEILGFLAEADALEPDGADRWRIELAKAEVYARRGWWDVAAALYRRVLADSPRRDEVHRRGIAAQVSAARVGSGFDEAGRERTATHYRAALVEVDRFLEIHPSSFLVPEVCFHASLAWQGLGDPERALPELAALDRRVRRSGRNDPYHGDVREHLAWMQARLFLAKGETSRARDVLAALRGRMGPGGADLRREDVDHLLGWIDERVGEEAPPLGNDLAWIQGDPVATRGRGSMLVLLFTVGVGSDAEALVRSLDRWRAEFGIEGVWIPTSAVEPIDDARRRWQLELPIAVQAPRTGTTSQQFGARGPSLVVLDANGRYSAFLGQRGWDFSLELARTFIERRKP